MNNNKAFAIVKWALPYMALFTVFCIVLLVVSYYNLPRYSFANASFYALQVNWTNSIARLHVNPPKNFSGTWYQYHRNGTLKRRASYVQGEIDGVFEEYSNAGDLLLIGTYHKGIPNGLFQYQNGKRIVGCIYKDGKPWHGTFPANPYSVASSAAFWGLLDLCSTQYDKGAPLTQSNQPTPWPLIPATERY